jgi:hypothetical protein
MVRNRGWQGDMLAAMCEGKGSFVNIASICTSRHVELRRRICERSLSRVVVSEKVEQIMILYQIFKFKMTNLSTRNICRPSIQRRIKDKVPITSNNGLFKRRFRLEKVGQVAIKL